MLSERGDGRFNSSLFEGKDSPDPVSRDPAAGELDHSIGMRRQ
ncbi:MAG: hypothetical protein QOE24_86, partial [Frankiales bacterium]|nr:hypothetical protein [Frankiales bacterium]